MIIASFGLRLRGALEAADPGRIRALVEATGFFSNEEVAVAGELAEERLARGEASGYEFLLAEAGQERRLVGYTCYGRVPMTVSTYDLYWIVVDPQEQGAGLGRRLLAESEAAILAAGGTALYAETSGRLQYAPTRGFYRRCGYHETAVLVDFYAPGDDKVIFAKRLEAMAATAATRAAGRLASIAKPRLGKGGPPGPPMAPKAPPYCRFAARRAWRPALPGRGGTAESGPDCAIVSRYPIPGLRAGAWRRYVANRETAPSGPQRAAKTLGAMRLTPLTLLVVLAAPFLMGASGEMPPLVQDIGVSLLTAGVLSIVFSRLKIPAIAAFLVAGVVVGPVGAGLVTDEANIATIAGLGLILLLFLIGLEIDFRKLMASGQTILVTGVLQFPLCVLFGWAACKGLVALGIGSGILSSGGAASYVPLYVGFLLASSSTLLVVKLFEERYQLDTAVGRISLALLIFQDVWSIVVIALQPNFANPNLLPILFNFVGIVLVGMVAFVLAKYVLPLGFRWIAKSPELMLISAIGWCFGVGFLGNNLDAIAHAVTGVEHIGLSVSMEMGALLAGAAIASLPYSTEVTTQVGTVKNFFVTLFFIGLGMRIPLPDEIDVLVLALIFSTLALLARPIIFFPLLYFTGLYRRSAMVSAIRLAQISEFGLVIAYVGFNLGHVKNGFVAAAIFAFVITALITPFLFRKADLLYERMAPLLGRLGFKSPQRLEEETGKQYCLALLGFHRVASSLLYELARRHPALLTDTLVVDFNVNIHEQIAALGPTVTYGDFSKPDTILHAGVDRARVIVCTIPDDLLKGTSNRKIVRMLRNMNTKAIIIVNAFEFEEAARLYEAGADYVYVPRVDNARALEPAIIAALDGTLAVHRAKLEEIEGKWRDRNEVFA